MSKSKKRNRFSIIAWMFFGLSVFNVIASFVAAVMALHWLSPIVYAYVATAIVLGAAWVARGTGYLLPRVLFLTLFAGSALVLEQGLFEFSLVDPTYWQHLAVYYFLLAAATIVACVLWWVFYQLYRSRSGVDPWQFSLQKLLI